MFTFAVAVYFDMINKVNTISYHMKRMYGMQIYHAQSVMLLKLKAKPQYVYESMIIFSTKVTLSIYSSNSLTHSCQEYQKSYVLPEVRVTHFIRKWGIKKKILTSLACIEHKHTVHCCGHLCESYNIVGFAGKYFWCFHGNWDLSTANCLGTQPISSCSHCAVTGQ